MGVSAIGDILSNTTQQRERAAQNERRKMVDASVQRTDSYMDIVIAIQKQNPISQSEAASLPRTFLLTRCLLRDRVLFSQTK